MMKRIHYASITFVFTVLLGLTACGQDAVPEPDAQPTPESATPEIPSSEPPAPEETVVAVPDAEPPVTPAETAPPPIAPPQDGLDKLADFLSKVETGLKLAQTLKETVEDTIEQVGEIPAEFDVVRTRDVQPADSPVRSMNMTDSGSIVIEYAGEGDIAGGTIELKPVLEESGVTWTCSGGTLPAEYRPADCG